MDRDDRPRERGRLHHDRRDNSDLQSAADQPNNKQSVQSGTKQTKLALVGMHVVGSTLGHPEMLWATFEHVNNTPKPQYTFTTTSSAVGTQPADGPGGWSFSSTGGTNPNANIPRITANGTTLSAASDQTTIGPSAGLDYERVTRSFFAISMERARTIFYSRCNFSRSTQRTIHCFDLVYPQAEKRAWDPVVTRISLSLRPLER
jgi:hypothetical protein